MDSEKSKMVRCKRRISSSFCVPNDVIYIILLYLPADILYNVMRYICKGWNSIIQSSTFRASHLQKHLTTNNALIFHCNNLSGFVVKATTSHGSPVLEVKNLKFKFYQRAWGSCNGLQFILGPPIDDPLRRRCNIPSYVVNPLTKKYLTLPLFPYYLTRYRCSFGYVASSKVYKVMHYAPQLEQCLILSVGVDKAWRQIDSVFKLTLDFKRVLLASHSRVTIRGCVYYIHHSFSFILRFDMETETFGEIPLSTQNSNGRLLAMDNTLCYWTWRSIDDFLFNIWLMKDPEKSGNGQWEKLIDLKVEGYMGLNNFRPPLPIGWLKSRELLVLRGDAHLIVYNFNTGKFDQIKGMMEDGSRFWCDLFCESHMDSLVSFDNLYKSRDEIYSEENMRPEFAES